MAQQSQAGHRGDIKAADYSQELRGSSHLWDSMRPLTEAELQKYKAAEAEAKAAIDACAGEITMARKLLDNHRAVKAGKRVLATKAEARIYGEFQERMAAWEQKSGIAPAAIPAPSARPLPRAKPALDFTTAYARLSGKGIEHKHVLGNVKAQDTGNGVGIISGYLSRWSLDQGNDQISPHAYDATLAALTAQRDAKGSRYLFPILLGHDMNRPVGGWLTAVPDADGLKVTGEIDLSTADGQAAFAMCSRGYANGLSIGYQADKYHWSGQTRILDQVTLFEGSITGFPMHVGAYVTNANLA